MLDKIYTNVETNVTIIDNSTGKVLESKPNAIHSKNMAIAIARGLSNSTAGAIYKLKLGNQGTYIDSNSQIVFRPTNTTMDSATADLYNPTYAEVIDDVSVNVGNGNSVTYTTIPNSNSVRVIITCVVSANEAYDNAVDTNNQGQIDTSLFFFDELGLFTQGTGETTAQLNATDELMVSHLIFSPIEHTGNRELTVVYTLTISVA